MLWDVQALMKPALSVIDMIPDVHRTAALSSLHRAIYDGRPLGMRLSPEEKELALFEGRAQLTSPVGARILLRLYFGGHLKLKKRPQKSLPALEAYAATEDDFRARVARIEEAETRRLDRIAALLAKPELAQPEELTPELIEKIMNARLGFGVAGEMMIGGQSYSRG